jgi:hypothetical protein
LFGWLEIACAPGLILLTTWLHLHDDSSMAAIVWVWSLLVAGFAYLIPGVVLLLAPRWGWLLQPLPVLTTGYLVFLGVMIVST